MTCLSAPFHSNLRRSRRAVPKLEIDTAEPGERSSRVAFHMGRVHPWWSEGVGAITCKSPRPISGPCKRTTTRGQVLHAESLAEWLATDL